LLKQRIFSFPSSTILKIILTLALNFYLGVLTLSAAAVCGVAFCASVATSTKEDTEQTVRLARIVKFYHSYLALPALIEQV
jgi:hypothetical protein